MRAHRLSRDAALVCLAGGVRAAAVSLVGVIIAIHFAAAGASPLRIGVVIGAGVAGSALATILCGVWANAWGRRRTLITLSLLSGAGYIGVASTNSLLPLIAVAFVGMVNGMGRDRGPASALEQAFLPETTTDQQRTWTLAWYNAAVDGGHALGALGAVTPTVLARVFAISDQPAHALTFMICGAALMLSGLPYWRLSVDVPDSAGTALRAVPQDPGTRSVIRRLSGLFALDSIGGGFLSSALIAYWFFERYGTTEVQLAGLFFAARALNVVSHLAAAWIARRIGLLNTMVWTHLPSSVLLMIAPAAPTAGLAAALFLARESLVEMDVPTRQSYVLAVVPPAARTFASSMTNVTRNIAWAVGPLVGGAVMQNVSIAGPLFIGGTIKIGYDLLLYRSFRSLRPPEES